MGRNNADFDKERIMDYSVNPKTGNMHPIVESGEGPNAATYTKLDKTEKDTVKRKKPTRTKTELKQQGRQENDSSAERYHELRGE